MLNEAQYREIIGATAYDQEGEKIGKVGQLFLDDETGAPEFVTVNTGFFGTSESFVPVQDATYDDGRFTVPFGKDQVKNAPNIDLDQGHLDQEQEQELYTYYGRGWSESDTGSGTRPSADRDRGVAQAGQPDARADRETTPTGGDGDDDAMTRSEEHLEVGTRQEQAGRARLRKYVTTEMETRTVPVRKERAVLETEPITDANRGDSLDGPEISEDEHEVVLHEERPVVETVVEPVERVRIGTETVQEEETVTGEVRKEHIEVEGDVDGSAR